MRESDDGIDTPLLPGDFRLEAFHDRLADTVHAAHVGDDPDLVAHAYLPVSPAEALEGPLDGCIGNVHQGRLVAIFQQALQVGLDAGVVHHGTGGRIARHVPDRETVLDDVLPGLEVPEDNLVPAGNIHRQGHAFHDGPFGEVLKGDGDVVGGVDLDVVHRFLDFARNDRNQNWK